MHANVDSFQRLLRPLTDKLGDRMGEQPSRRASTRRFAGAEVGMLLGWMSTRVLGQYDLLVVEDDGRRPTTRTSCTTSGPNVLALEKRFAFPPKEFRLWLALHEVTHRAQFTGVPWLREHFLGLVDADARLRRPRPEAVLRRAHAGRSTTCAHGRNPLDDGGLATLLASPEQREVLDKIGGLMSLLEGHGDVTMDRAGADRIPSADRFARVLRERRASATPAGQAAPAAARASRRRSTSTRRASGSSPRSSGSAADPSCSSRCGEGPSWLPTLARDPASPSDGSTACRLSDELVG